MYTQQAEKIELGLIVPRTNVATLERSALVIEGVCRSRNALLNGDTSNYDWDNGYTCHQLGSGAIMVQLGQPYALNSMRMLLWDCDDRSYNYYIEVSVNQRDWEVVCDRTREPARSWQMISFPRRPVVFIRIVGTHNTANEVFHCVHFEAPGSLVEKMLTNSHSRHSGEVDDVELDTGDEALDTDNDVVFRQDNQDAMPSPQQRHHQLQGLHDPFQVPLAAGPPVPPLLPLGAAPNNLQGLGVARVGPQQHQQQPLQQQQQGAQQLPGAIPRSVRGVRRESNPPPSPSPS